MSDLKTTKELLELAIDCSNWLKGEKYDSLLINCMNKIGTYSTTINTESVISKWTQKNFLKIKHFNLDDVYDVKAYSIKPYPNKIRNAVTRDENVITLNLNSLMEYDSIRIEVDYKMDEDFLDGLIRKRSSPEPLQDSMKYHISAQLKDPHSLIKGFSELEIEEFPVTTDVYLQNDINTNISPYLNNLVKVESEMLAETDPHSIQKFWNLKQEQIRLMKKVSNKDAMEKLNEVSIFLKPAKFINFLKIDHSTGFRLHQCEWGHLFRALGLIQLPEKIGVITRTDLSIDKPGSSGVLLYEKNKFVEGLHDLFN